MMTSDARIISSRLFAITTPASAARFAIRAAWGSMFQNLS
jgi:hypothetical protein